MNYKVIIKKKIVKRLNKLPEQVQDKLMNLVDDLSNNGPEQPGWKNYCKLSSTEFHCHLGYKWVACWRCEINSITIEVYYAGSRENAPY